MLMNSRGNNKCPNWSTSTLSVPGFEGKRILQISNFLPKKERDCLFETVCEHQTVFQSFDFPESKVEGTLHLSLGQESLHRPEVDPIRKVCESLSQQIMKLLPELFETLGVKPFPVAHIPLSLMNGLNGHTGDVHNDESGGRFKISLLYYFNKTPKTFQGGALSLYETDPTKPMGYKYEAFTTLEHQDNVLIAFPSETYHGITDVKMDSAAFEDGRFVVVGFLGP